MSDPSFVTRLGLIQNLKKHLLSGRSAAMIGGPMIGKTTLSHRLAEEMRDENNRAVIVSLNEMNESSDFWAILMEAILRQGISPDQKNPYRKAPESFMEFMSQLHHIYEKTPNKVNARKLTLLIDDCDCFLPDHIALISQTINMAMELLLPQIDAICWIGGLDWGDWVAQHQADFLMSLRLYPLSVVPIREARAIITAELGAAACERVWRETGGHPFLMAQVFSGDSPQKIEAFNQRLAEVLLPEDFEILEQLDASGQWVRLDSFVGKDGKSPPKKGFDRLCMMGVIVRTLDKGRAVVRKTAALSHFKSPA